MKEDICVLCVIQEPTKKETFALPASQVRLQTQQAAKHVPAALLAPTPPHPDPLHACRVQRECTI